MFRKRRTGLSTILSSCGTLLVFLFAPMNPAGQNLLPVAFAQSSDNTTDFIKSDDLAYKALQAWTKRESDFRSIELLTRTTSTKTSEGADFQNRNQARKRKIEGKETAGNRYFVHFNVLTPDKLRNEYWEFQNESDAKKTAVNFSPGKGSTWVATFDGERYLSLHPDKTDPRTKVKYDGLVISKSYADKHSVRDDLLRCLYLGSSERAFGSFDIREADFVVEEESEEFSRPTIVAKLGPVEMRLDPDADFLPLSICIRTQIADDFYRSFQIDCDYKKLPTGEFVLKSFSDSWYMPNGTISRSDVSIVESTTLNRTELDQKLFDIPLKEGMCVTDQTTRKILRFIVYEGKLVGIDPFASYSAALETIRLNHLEQK